MGPGVVSERVVISVKRGEPWAYIISPFSAKDTIKRIPQAKWSKDLRQWMIPRDCVRVAEKILSEAGFDVMAERGEAPASPIALFEAILTLSGDQAKAVYRRLQQALHPDAGGSEALSKALNEAWRRRS